MRINEQRLPQNCSSKTVLRNHFTWGEKSNSKYLSCIFRTGLCSSDSGGLLPWPWPYPYPFRIRFVLRCSYGGGVCIRQRAVGRVGAGTISVSVVRTDISLRGVLSGSYGLSLPLCIVDGSTGVCLNLVPWRTPAEAEGQQLHRVGTVVQCSAGSASASVFQEADEAG